MNEIIRSCIIDQERFLDVERTLIGVTHAELGEAVTTRWQFPVSVRAAVGAHHAPENAPAAACRLASIVRCADILCCHEDFGFVLTARDEDFTADLLAGIGVSVEQLTAVRDELKPEIAEAEAMLGAPR